MILHYGNEEFRAKLTVLPPENCAQSLKNDQNAPKITKNCEKVARKILWRAEMSLSPTMTMLQDDIDSSSNEYRLVTSAVFDRETKAEYQLQVTCHDSAADGKARTSTETLAVDVADVNDNDPVFRQTVYRAELIENNYVGAVVFKV